MKYCVVTFIFFILWTDYSFKFCLDRLSLEGVCSDTVLRQSDTALPGIVAFIFVMWFLVATLLGNISSVAYVAVLFEHL